MSAGKRIRLVGSAVASKLALAAAWGSSGSSSSSAGMYYQNNSYDWMYSSKNIAMKVEGCVWATTDDNEDVGCMEDESGDGTTYWYQMAMCRRAQVAYSVYASQSGSTSCGSTDFKGTFVTQDGLAEFAYLMETYDGYSPITSDSVGDAPLCEEGNNGYYLSVGCASDGTFTIDEFSDQYCLTRVGTYSYLSDVNSIFKNYFNSCYGIYSANSDESVDYSAAGALVTASKACGALDSYLCQDNERISGASSGKMNTISSAGHTIANFNVANKAKYALGTLCLIGSLFMFLGILFTNRRKRRAMMHRKMRASRSKRSSSKKRSSSRHKSSSSRSKSRSRGDASRSRSKSSRSKSRARSASKSKKVDDGVFA